MSHHEEKKDKDKKDKVKKDDKKEKEKKEDKKDEHKKDEKKDEKKDADKDAKKAAKAAKEAEQKKKKAEKFQKRKEGRKGAVHQLSQTLQSLLNKPDAALNTDIEVFPANGRDAWARLKVGNERFAKGDLLGFLANMAEEISPTARQNLSKTQTPYASVLTCSDSRVAPELVFDEGLGELFIIRIAGNVVSSHAIGSIEYGVDHLHTPLLVIMGHQSCGAVFANLSAALAAREAAHEAPHADPHAAPHADPHAAPHADPHAAPHEAHETPVNIVELLKPIDRASKTALASGEQDETKLMDLAVIQNVRNTKSDVLALSPCVKGLVDSGKLTIVCCVYYLDAGVVREIVGA